MIRCNDNVGLSTAKTIAVVADLESAIRLSGWTVRRVEGGAGGKWWYKWWMCEYFGNGSPIQSGHNKVNLGIQALRQVRAPVAGLEPTTEELQQISGRAPYPLCHQCSLLL
ncbi:hypothetical protein PoB_003513700 [Plakobranchus ocellatus]|uniref:Uncharacterized protein n=1 Tax=Plakobranchus ocellatus TaxID=259542 RepID=A0AAV4AN04_9GAST|nr:hypothetical protein PoB_003513700 [Plakobranchus ocellatus]